MRDIVEIGIGREARRIYGLDDIALVPTRRTWSSRGVNTSWWINAYDFEFPMMMYPTGTTVSPESVAEFARLGGLAVLNAEGIWTRHAGAQDKIAEPVELIKNAATEHESRAVNRELQELHSAPIDINLLTERIKEIRATGAITAVRVSPQHVRELAPLIIKADVDLLVIQGMLISAKHITTQGEPLNLKDFIGNLDVPVIVGGVVDYQAAMHLIHSGTADVVVGTGFTTSPGAFGIDVPMATATAGAATTRKDYLNETKGRYIHVIVDGGIGTASNIAKAITCGADAVALSSMLATVNGAPRQGYAWPSVAAHPKYPRDAVWPTAGDGKGLVSLEEALFGPSASPFGDRNLAGGPRRAMVRYGFTNLESFHRAELSVRPKGF